VVCWGPFNADGHTGVHDVSRRDGALDLSAERSGVTQADNGMLCTRTTILDTCGGEKVEGYDGLGIRQTTRPTRPKQRQIHQLQVYIVVITFVFEYIRSRNAHDFYSYKYSHDTEWEGMQTRQRYKVQRGQILPPAERMLSQDTSESLNQPLAWHKSKGAERR
jgi:hypothetical protein